MKRKASYTSNSSRPTKASKLTPAQTAAVNQIVTKKINSVLDYKTCTQSYVNASVDWSGYIWNVLANMTRGDGAVNQFAGNNIVPKSLTLRYQVRAGDADNMMRVVLIQWFGDTHAVVPSGILDGTILGGANAPLAGYRWDNRPNVKILYDKLHQLMQQNGTIGPNLAVEKITIPSGKIKKMYLSATAPEAQRGQLFLIVVSDSGAGSHPEFRATTQMTYTD